VLIYLANGRFRDFFTLARQHASLVGSILIKIVLPRRMRKGASAIFRNDGGRVRLRKKRPAGTWG
jgi:hypothetical protein